MERKLQITGRGKLSVTPDTIFLSFNVSSQRNEYEETIIALNQQVEELRIAVEREGVERKKLKTTNFSVRKETTWNKKTEKYDFAGFKATHNLELELPLEKALINSLLNKITQQLNDLDFNISFGVKDTSAQQQNLLLQAIGKAKENAALIAQATGVELLEILHIDYTFRELVIRSQRYDYPVYEADTIMTSDAAPDFEPEDIDLAENVTITWRIN